MFLRTATSDSNSIQRQQHSRYSCYSIVVDHPRMKNSAKREPHVRVRDDGSSKQEYSWELYGYDFMVDTNCNP